MVLRAGFGKNKMRVSHIENRIEQQLALKGLIEHAVDNVLKVGYSNVTSQRVQARLTSLKDNWEKFSLNHDAIGMAMTKLSPDDKSTIQQHSYFLENLFATTHESYLDAVEKFNSIFDTTTDYNMGPASVQSSSQTSSLPIFFHHARLPRIDIPKFNGTPADWLSFKDLFSSLIVANPTLTSVEKLQYLKTSLVGSASHLLKNTTLTADNFQRAWDALISFYENKRLLVNAALHSLVTLKRMTKESAQEMEQLYTNIMQIYRTLETLQRPINTWDDFLVFITVQRLDSESVKAWEHHLGSSKDPPTWTQFSEFLVTRLLSLQAFEKSRTGKSSTQPSPIGVKSHFQGKIMDNNSTKASSCSICASNHYTAHCPQYCSKPVSQRLAIINRHRLCYNCLGPHKVSACRVIKRCQKCGRKHHTTIHQINPKATAEPVKSKDSPSTGSKLTETHVLHSTLESQVVTSSVFLATAIVIVASANGETMKARALIDQGSEVSLISQRIVQLLRLPRHHSSISLIGIGASKSNQTRGLAQLKLRPHFNSNFECSVSAHILPKLTSFIPSFRSQKCDWPHLEGLPLADPNFSFPENIDILLGADVFAQIVEDGIVKGETNSPIAQQTKFGWIISGPSGSNTSAETIQSFQTSIDKELYELLSRFWQLEESPSKTTSLLSTEEQECEQHFRSTHTRDTHGRYTVKLPFKQPTDKLGDSYPKALRVLTSLKKKFELNPTYAHSYYEFMNDYEQLHHMTRVSDIQSDPQLTFYLPHHGVLRDSSLNTKLRVVFNGSSRTTSGFSLNDLLHTGAKLQSELFDVLLEFRQYRYVFSSDIEKMYRQIKLHQKDWNFQRILWIDQTGQIHKYQLTTVTYGLACAPFLALRTLAQLVEDDGAKFPLAIPVLTKGRYVDDLFGGADSIQQAQNIVQQVTQLCMAGGFPLSKWTSNHPAILNSISSEKQVHNLSINFEKDLTVHVLGLCWNPSSDTFNFTIKLLPSTVITKRTILSTISKLFDPLGFLSPVIIKAKILIQELWSIKIDWDDSLPEQFSSEWIDFINQLNNMPEMKVYRWLGFKSYQSFELHGFCDASQQAICAAVYTRTVNDNEEIITHLVCSKTKVAPLKRMTIPRLELSGAVLLTKLMAHLLKILPRTDIQISLWTDSSIAYTWINNHPSRWRDFVQNRVCYIQETLPQAIWRFVPGAENPADLATRGLTPNQLYNNSVWWNGPNWLSQDPSTWTHDPNSLAQTEYIEERPSHVTYTRSDPIHLWELITRYSNLTRLLRITALCRRVISRFRRTPNSSLTTPITTKELEDAKFYWVKVVQQVSFQPEIKILSKGKLLPRSNSLLRLIPFIDSNGLLRVSGRLQASLLPDTSKHPLILPKSSKFTSLIISDAHSRTLHGGTQATLAFIRTNYWILGGRTPVRSFILKCIPCTRYRQKRAQQLMGQLPFERVTPSRPFLNSGVDYAGPFHLKTWKGKNARKYKAYIALFVCFSTSAVHLELVTDYSTEAFIAAFKRFTARRGICVTLTSDCGTNFKGADSELKHLFSSSSKKLGHLAATLANDGTQWKFNPPGAPHFGGKWESGVKSVKHHLRRVMGDTILTYEEVTTLLTQIEAVLNSRPISPLSDDPDDLNALTPGHFLIGCAPTVIPEPSFEEVQISRLSRWQLTRQMLDSFWSRWSKECLQRYLAIYKWNQSSTSIEVGSLVLVVDERFPPSKWPLGRVTQIHPGKDGITRVVTVRTQASILKRPIVKLCPLPIDTDSL